MNAATNDYGVNNDGKGNLRGYAWSDSVGWVNFESTGAPYVDLRTGCVTGYAWSATMGWIGFSNMAWFLQSDVLDAGSDDDHDGMPDSWERDKTGNTNMLSATGDYDNDGIPDPLEYAAGTNPTNAGSLLEISCVGVTNGTSVTIVWPSVPERTYRIQASSNLIDFSGWVDSGLGLLSAGSSSSSAQQVSLGSFTQRFFRVKAIVPLSE